MAAADYFNLFQAEVSDAELEEEAVILVSKRTVKYKSAGLSPRKGMNDMERSSTIRGSI